MIVYPFRDNWKEIHVLITQFIHSHYERKGMFYVKNDFRNFYQIFML